MAARGRRLAAERQACATIVGHERSCVPLVCRRDNSRGRRFPVRARRGAGKTRALRRARWILVAVSIAVFAGCGGSNSSGSTTTSTELTGSTAASTTNPPSPQGDTSESTEAPPPSSQPPGVEPATPAAGVGGPGVQAGATTMPVPGTTPGGSG